MSEQRTSRTRQSTCSISVAVDDALHWYANFCRDFSAWKSGCGDDAPAMFRMTSCSARVLPTPGGPVIRMPMQAWKHTAVAHMFSIRPRVRAMPASMSHLSKKRPHAVVSTCVPFANEHSATAG